MDISDIFILSYSMVHIWFQVRGQNEPSSTNNKRFSKEKNIGMDYNSLYDKFESVIEDKEDENHGHMRVKTNK